MFYKRAPLNNNMWPFGKDGDLIILSGTQTLASGSVKDYRSIYIAYGATLNIQGSYALTVIGSRGPVVIDGSIISNNTGSHGTVSINTTLPDRRTVVTYSGDQASGGAGGNGWASVYLGGSQFNGRGGGGGGGWTGGGGGGQNGNTVNNDYTLGNGAAGQPTSNGYRYSTPGYGGGGGGGQGAGRGGAGGSDQGGGGGGGGYPGKHALPICIKSKSVIRGAGIISLIGNDGFNGGNGGNGSGTKGTGGQGGGGGGGGGGGAGGNGGIVHIYSKGFYVGVDVDGGSGGSAGAGGPGYAGYTGGSGANGSDGLEGSIIVTNIV